MNPKELIKQVSEIVKQELSKAEGGHDWLHIERVHRNAMLLCAQEEANQTVVELACLLHDIADHKFHNGDEEMGPNKARQILESLQVEESVTNHVVSIIQNISFKGGKNQPAEWSKEAAIVQDADRLDAIGAIGIARAFNFGGFKNRPLYHPQIKPNLNMSKEEYMKSLSPTVNHFYEKLLLLKDLMNTPAGRVLAEERHRFMLEYLKQLEKETGESFGVVR